MHICALTHMITAVAHACQASRRNLYERENGDAAKTWMAKRKGCPRELRRHPQPENPLLVFLFFSRRNDYDRATRFSGGAFCTGSTGGTLRTGNRSRHRNHRRTRGRTRHGHRLDHCFLCCFLFASAQSKRGGDDCCGEYRISHYRSLLFWVTLRIQQDSYPLLGLWRLRLG